ncbi:MAG: CHRD domain-containing protein [Krumholzibacteria bacterium]|nr:CHRD domain-containing protein [Candidatus Krumholzibacteria bacterium]
MHSLSKSLILLACAACLGAGAALADIATYTTILSGANEVPPNASTAGGAATIVVDTETLQAAWTLEFDGLSAAQTGAHFHTAPAGANGGVAFGLPLGSPVNGIWAMTAGQLADLAAGNIYVNVHTTAFPGGEIRGQMELSSVVSNDEASFGAVKALFR